jgi:hypothetical protein
MKLILGYFVFLTQGPGSRRGSFSKGKEAAAGNFPPGHAAFAASDASILGPTVPLSGPIGRHPSARRCTRSMRGDGRTSPLMRPATSRCTRRLI